uniref:flavin-containing monooxygenase n=1 Tax=Pseudomonadota TaxID=1224 RepID=UPI004047B775
MKKIAILGAGAAGLCAAKHLTTNGFDVTVFEKGTQIGGLWVYENDNGLSPAYRSLHVNSENRVTAYVDFPFPSDAPLYPNHHQMAAYLQSYARHFDLVRHIRFQSEVESISRSGASDTPIWWVKTKDAELERFDAVVVASGHQGEPLHPQFASDFTGEYLHSHLYRIPEPFGEKRVVVVGVGNSACDIAADICTHAKSTTIAARSPVLLMPRMLFGMPTSRTLAKIEKPWVPWPIKRFFRGLIARTVHGTMEQWGFRTPTRQTHPAGHHLLIGHFVWDRIRAKPGVRTVQGKDVIFEDGSVETFDTMIAATGYKVHLPFLQADLSPIDGPWLNLYHRVVHPFQEGLYFMGFFNVSGGGNIRMMDDQAQWIVSILTKKSRLPSQEVMLGAIASERKTIRKRYPDSPRYGLELDPADYRQQLKKLQNMRRSFNRFVTSRK